MAAAASSEPDSWYRETVAGDEDCRTLSYADEKDDSIDEFVTRRAQDTSTKCKRCKLRDTLITEKVSGVLDRIKTSIRTPTTILASVLNEVARSTSFAVLTKQRVLPTTLREIRTDKEELPIIHPSVPCTRMGSF